MLLNPIFTLSTGFLITENLQGYCHYYQRQENFNIYE